MLVNVYMGDKKLEEKDFKNYICISQFISDLVNEVYYSYISSNSDSTENKQTLVKVR